MQGCLEQKDSLRIVRDHKAKLREDLIRRMVSPNEAAIIFSISPGTLGNWRSAKRGPKYFKVGHKVLYNLADLEAYFTAQPVLTVDSIEAR